MMKMVLFWFFFLLFFSRVFGQNERTDKQIMDSLLKNDKLLMMINKFTSPTSFAKFDVGIGNNIYVDNNKQMQSLQNKRPVAISPSIGYYHKSGFGLSAKGYLFRENEQTKFYQYTLSPSYNYVSGNVLNVSLYYTHYFVKDVYSVQTSPIQNDFYSSINLKKGWLKPGLSADYSSGNSYDVIRIDTSFYVLNQLIRVRYTDTAVIKLNTFSIAATVEHEFDLGNIFSHKDAISFIPQLSLISGINKYAVNHKSTNSYFNTYTKRKIQRIRHFQSQSDNNKFELQSISLDLLLDYSIGKFYVDPEWYLGYYLPKTNDNRLTYVFNLNIGITL